MLHDLPRSDAAARQAHSVHPKADYPPFICTSAGNQLLFQVIPPRIRSSRQNKKAIGPTIQQPSSHVQSYAAETKPFHPTLYNATETWTCSPGSTPLSELGVRCKGDKARKTPINHLRDVQRLSDIDEVYVGQVIGVGDGPGGGTKAYGDRRNSIAALDHIGLSTTLRHPCSRNG